MTRLGGIPNVFPRRRLSQGGPNKFLTHSSLALGQGAIRTLVGNHAVASIIREGKIERITSVIQAGKREGMQLLDDALEKMAKEDIIEGRDAYMKANEKRRFEQYADQ